jgi:CubicO group peptidase (beta-lactamase class C family)
MNIRKLAAIILMASISGFAFGQSTEETINKMLLGFYEKHKLNGGISIAISRNGRLVYVGSVGYADIKHTVRLTPDYRMRIASATKPITKIAIMKLQEEGKLNVNDFVFGRNGVFNNEYGMPTYNGNSVDITIKQFLDHKSGGWGRSFNSGASRYRNIDQWLKQFPLEYSPGTNEDYSNFGYYILGRIIERKSGMTYENYVKENILKPVGINGMRIGATRSGTDEVEYIATPGTDVNNPATYNNPVTLDSFGGWVASPIELLRILAHYGSTIGNNWNHSGSMPGTYTWIAKRSDGFNYVMLANYRPPDPRYTWSTLFNEIRAAISEWPTGIEF